MQAHSALAVNLASRAPQLVHDLVVPATEVVVQLRVLGEQFVMAATFLAIG